MPTVSTHTKSLLSKLFWWIYGLLTIASAIWVLSGTLVSSDAATRATLSAWVLGPLGVVVGIPTYVAQRRERGRDVGDAAAPANARSHARAYSKAVARLGSSEFFVRVASVHALAELADHSDSQRQRCITALCLSLQRSHRDRDFSIEIQKILHDRLAPSGGSPAWKSCEFKFSQSDLSGFDLRDLELVGGRLELVNVRISDTGIDLRNLVLREGAELCIAHSRISADVRLDGLLCADASKVTFSELTISLASVSLREARVAANATLSFSKILVEAGGMLSVSDAVVIGTVHIGDLLLVGERAVFSAAHATVDAGLIRIDRINQYQGSLVSFAGIILRCSGGLVVNEHNSRDSHIHVLGSRLEEKASIVLHGVRMTNSTLDLSGSRTHTGSHLLISTDMGGKSTFRAHAVENNDEDSVLVMQSRSSSGDTSFEIESGGNYGGDTHIVMNELGDYPVGRFLMSNFSDFGGSLEVSVSHRADVDVQLPLRAAGGTDQLHLSGPPRLLEAYSVAGGKSRVSMNARHEWFHHMRERFPFEGSKWEWSWDEIDDLLRTSEKA